MIKIEENLLEWSVLFTSFIFFFTFAHQVDALKMIYQFDCMFIYREENYSAITSSFSNYKVTFKRDPNKHS